MSTAEQAVPQHHHDDQSHYEISLTAGQAFIAFVLLLLSLAAAFAFGLMIGRGQADERLIVRKDPAVVNESPAAAKKNDARIEELGVADDDFKAPAPVTDSAAAAAVASPVADDALPVSIAEDRSTTHALPDDALPVPAPAEAAQKPPAEVATPQPRPAAAVPPAAAPAHKQYSAAPHYAQLLSTADQKTAEALAAKLIDGGFPSAYVERGANEKGTIHRVRVKFPTETAARAAETRLKEFSKEVWITKQ